MHIIDADHMKYNLTAMKREYDAITLDGMIKGLDDAPEIDPVHAAGGCYCHECDYCGPDAFGNQYSCHTMIKGRGELIPKKAFDFCSVGKPRDKLEPLKGGEE